MKKISAFLFLLLLNAFLFSALSLSSPSNNITIESLQFTKAIDERGVFIKLSIFGNYGKKCIEIRDINWDLAGMVFSPDGINIYLETHENSNCTNTGTFEKVLDLIDMKKDFYQISVYEDGVLIYSESHLIPTDFMKKVPDSYN